MKKFSIFLMLMAFFAPLAMNAQETLTVCENGTATNNYVPMYGGYFDDFTKSEFVIPADQLEDMAGGTITAMKFYISSVSTYGSGWGNTHQVVFLKEVESATLSAWSGMDDATIVFDGMFTVPASTDTEFEITFTNTYEYGGGNLLVGIYNTVDGSYRTVTWLGETVTGASGGASNGTSLDGVTFTQRNFVPKTTFTYTPASTTCPNPKTLVSSDVTAHGATMTWTMDDETGDYQFNLEYKKTTEEQWTRIGLGNTRTYTLTGLDAETEYQVRIQTACNPENTVWKNGSNFTTLVACPAPTDLAVTDGSITANEATVTWTGTSNSYVVMIGEEEIAMGTIDFENQAIPTFFTNDASRPWKIEPSGANNSNYCIIPGNKGVNSSSSDLTVEVTGPCTISFKAKVSSESGYDYGRFLIDGTQKMQISGTQDWTSYSYELTEGTHTLVWRYYKDGSSASGNDLFYVDDITMPVPTVSSWTEYTTTAQTYTFENLTPNTPYQVKVKGNCGSEGYSAEAGPVSFTTLVSCTTPENLHIVENSLTAHEVTIAWDAEEGDWFEYLLTDDASVTPETIGFNTLTQDHNEHWDALPGDTDHFFFLRKKCGDTDYSETITLNFHTLVACSAPTNLTVALTQGDGTKATFAWTENGSATAWQLCINGDEDNLIDMDENPYTYNGFTPETEYTAKVRAVCGGIDGESQWSNTVTFTPTNAYSLTVNDGTTTNSIVPIYGNWVDNSTRSQFIIPATDLTSMQWGSINKMTFYASADKSWGAQFKVYLTETCETTLSALQDWDDMQVVYEGTPSIVGKQMEIVFSTPYQYTGGNLLIGFYQTATGSYSSCSWYGVTATGASMGGYGTNINQQNFLPKTTFDYEPGEEPACVPAYCLAASDMSSHSVTLNWSQNGSAEAWDVAYSTDGENFTTVEAETNEDYLLEGLAPNTEYTVKVSPTGCEAWSNTVTFTTLSSCTVEDVTISNIGHYTADVNWTGESAEGFTVKYREAASTNALFSEDFEDATSFANWTFTSMNTANNIASGKAGRLTEGAHNGSYGFRFSSYNEKEDSETYDQYLVSPELTVTGDLKFYAKQYGSGDDIYVGYSTTTNDLSAFTWDETALALTTSWQEFTHELSSNVKYIAFHYYGEYKYYAYVDDIAITEPVPAGEWQTVTTDETTANLSQLTMGTTYDLTVVPNCDEALASEIQQFTTVSENLKYFITEGDWGTAANWEPAGAPTLAQDVILFANTTITGEAEAKSIAGTGTGEGTYTLTIENGGKLKHLNSGVRATVKKHINGYGAGNEADKAGYYLIANPITSSYTPKTDGSDGILVGNYDLYSWDYMQDLEWRNYEASAFTTINSGAYGYLYANENGTTLTYTGTINAYTGNKYRSASVATNPENYDFPSWYLLGNPYLYDAYLAGASTNGVALPYIKMNVDGDGFENVAAGTPIEPMQGFFYQGVTGATSAYVVTYEPTVQDEGKLNMNLRRGNKQLDNAILVFGGNQQMGKMTFRANSSKIYMPVEGKDYAIVSTESNMGEMPVSFKAENNGNYTLSFNAEEVSFAYLHLIDNMTGTETDLLANPSYSFEARTTDYASRFKLVFATGNNSSDDNFAFFSNGSFVINNEGNATLQVIDVTGRIVKSESINGCANVNVNAAPGVYMLRLVNGDSMKIQKVVVR